MDPVMRAILLVLPLAILGCKKASTAPSAAVELEPRSGSTATGKGEFLQTPQGVQATITVEKATPGQHGLHLHTSGDCSAPDAESAGPHWDPHKSPHGAPGTPAHAGDLGNITVGADGAGRLQIILSGATVAPGDMSVVGKAVVLHAAIDDLVTQPAGNAGARIACGVIRAR